LLTLRQASFIYCIISIIIRAYLLIMMFSDKWLCIHSWGKVKLKRR